MESVNVWLAIAQFIMVFIAIPLYKTIKSLEVQNNRLEVIIVDQQKQILNQQIEIELLSAIVFESSDPEVLRKHLLKRANHVKRD